MLAGLHGWGHAGSRDGAACHALPCWVLGFPTRRSQGALVSPLASTLHQVFVVHPGCLPAHRRVLGAAVRPRPALLPRLPHHAAYAGKQLLQWWLGGVSGLVAAAAITSVACRSMGFMRVLPRTTMHAHPTPITPRPFGCA